MTEPALPYALISAVLLVGLAQRLYALARDPADPLRRAICVVLAGLLLATVVQMFAAAIDGTTGVVHLSWALADVGAMVSACAGRLFLLHVDHPAAEVRDRARRRYLGLGAALAAATLLFVAFPPRPGEEAPFYDVVYIAYVATVLVPVLRLGVRYAGRTGRPSLRAGLRVVATGSAVGLAFLAVMGVELVGGVTEASAPLLAQLATVLELAAVVLLMVGVTMTAWGPALGGARRWLADHRAHRQLRPLWQALHDAEPGFALLPARRPIARWWSRGSDGDIGLLLYRRVIEIRDGMLALRDYRPLHVPVEDDPAATEAQGIALALRRRSEGAEPAGRLEGWAPVGPDMTDEVAWLTRVSVAFRGLTPAAAPTPRPSGSAR
jgi:hypothetical protein